MLNTSSYRNSVIETSTMLTRAENRWNFRCLNILSNWIFLPISVDESSGRISSQKVLHKLYCWYFLFGCQLLYGLYGFVRFIQLMLSSNLNEMMDHLFMHALIFPIILITSWNYQIFIKRPQETVILFNQLYSHKNNDVTRRKIFTWDFKYNRHELLTLSIPFIITGVGLFMAPIFLSDPNRMWILYSSVPTKYRHWTIFILLTIVDVFFLFRIFATVTFAFLNQLLFFQKCDTTFRSCHQNFRYLYKYTATKIIFFQKEDFRNQIQLPRVQEVQNLLKEMQSHFLYVHLFNRVYASIIFTWKLIALAYAIFGAFFAIRYNFDYPLTAIFASYVHAGIMFVYSLMYEKAFTIPENWRRVKSQLRVSADLSTVKQYQGAGKAAQFQKEIQRIPDIGVKVGGFHVLERTSTPNFVSFVISSVTSLLITFR